jgi:hypothetical protein
VLFSPAWLNQMKLVVPFKTILLFLCVIWLGAVGFGLYYVWAYENAPGKSATAPPAWPIASKIRRNDLPTLVLFIHPHCPCSRATIGELAVLMAHSQDLVNAHAMFVKPAGFQEDWAQTDLWHSAMAIPGVSVSLDEDGTEARRFGSVTSGQAVLYSTEGKLLFSGGITGSRGHSGDNDGRAAILSILTTGNTPTTATPVFGCPLVNAPADKQLEEFCNANHGK